VDAATSVARRQAEQRVRRLTGLIFSDKENSKVHKASVKNRDKRFSERSAKVAASAAPNRFDIF